MDDIEDKWDPVRRFTGVQYPRFDSIPDGPVMTSLSLCVCGHYWKNHRFVDGACPKIVEK